MLVYLCFIMHRFMMYGVMIRKPGNIRKARRVERYHILKVCLMVLDNFCRTTYNTYNYSIAVAEAMVTGEGTNTGNVAPAAPVNQGKESEQVTVANDSPPGDKSATPAPTKTLSLPEHVPYILIGAGTASFACMKEITERDPNAKVCCILYVLHVDIKIITGGWGVNNP